MSPMMSFNVALGPIIRVNSEINCKNKFYVTVKKCVSENFAV